MTKTPLPYDPAILPRELKRHYISATDDDITAMLKTLGYGKLDQLFDHIPSNLLFSEALAIPDELAYETLQERMESLALNNNVRESFISDGLPDFEIHDIISYVASIRNLTTAYTPYQPERSQGTLMSHWIYQSLMTMLTGFEAINSSLYDRSTAIYEAISTATRLKRNADTAIVSEGIYPGDLEVIETHVTDTLTAIIKLPLDPQTGRIEMNALSAKAKELGDRLAAIVFPQINSLGILEDVDTLTNFCAKIRTKSIAIIDPLLLGAGGLKPPADFGKKGVDMIVGEGQHLAIGPNFGGPGLGVFGVRFNDEAKNDVRSTPGRYVGKAEDINGRECRVMVLSTREQHIRKDKATSNICSNQAFLATLAGVAILARGESGMRRACSLAREQATETVNILRLIPGVRLAYPNAPFFNEFVLDLPMAVSELIEKGRDAGLHLGVNVSDRVAGSRNLLKISLSDKKRDVAKLAAFFKEIFIAESPTTEGPSPIVSIPAELLRQDAVGLPDIPLEEIKSYYQKLGDLNVSPDDSCYPLGSCTMKYNPYINDWAANLTDFVNVHPQAPIEDTQGCLELLYEIQEWFKAITGLPAVTTQPVAGAQGELTGLKMFQAYHRARGETKRDVIFIPKSAHGTNFATAIMAGFENKKVNGLNVGIIHLEADETGLIDMDDFDRKISAYGHHISAVMITNPNTSGLFETNFKVITDKIHELGGLVYMDGANMNAIAGWVNLSALGVDAVHQNLHKTWTIPHGGGGPGDAVVAVSERLQDYLPGYQIVKDGNQFVPVRPSASIGSIHRHWGNFAHKVRCYAYLLRLGKEGVKRMSAVSVLSARYLYEILRQHYPTLPQSTRNLPRMHEFIITLEEEDFARLEAIGLSKAVAIGRIGKLFLDFGFHAPTVNWPETLGLMIEPTESYSKRELDRFSDAVKWIIKLVRDCPEILNKTPFFTPVDRLDEVQANRNLCLNERITQLPAINENRLSPSDLGKLSIKEIADKIINNL